MSSARGFPQWTEQPMFVAALGFGCGIVIAALLDVPSREWLLATAALLIAAATLSIRDRAWAIFIALSCFVFLGGASYCLWQACRPMPPDVAPFTRESMEFEAHVTNTMLPRFDPAERELRTVEIEIESASDGEHRGPARFGARLTIHDNGRAIPDLKYGDRFRFTARLREPRNYANPGAMDYRGYLADKGIVALASVPSTSIEVLPGRVGTRYGFARAALRRSVLYHMLSLAEEPCASWRCMSREDVGVLAAMIIGEQSLLERATKVDFQRTGAFHILVVSGMNVGIVAFVVFWICRRLRTGPITATATTIVLSLFYAYMTDMGAPILRAVLMLAIYLVARLLYRDRYSLNSIGTAALILLVAHPPALFDPSFQLTFLSVAALGGIVQPLIERTLLPYTQALRSIGLLGYDTALAPHQAQLRLDIRLIAQKLAQLVPLTSTRIASVIAISARGLIALAELIVVTATLQIALALPMVWYFHRIAMVGIPVNVVIVPLTSLLMPVGIASVSATYLWQPLAKSLAMATAAVLHVIVGTVNLLASLPRADLRVATPTMTAAFFAGMIFLLALFAFKRSRRLALAASAALVIAATLLAWPGTPRHRTNATEITAIDVGQGDSLLIIDPSGKMLLVDGGGPPGFARSDSFDVGEDVVSPYLWSRGITQLDAVVLSHAHSDHMDGLRAVLTNFHPAELWIGDGVPENAPLMTLAQRMHTRVRHLHTGDELAIGELRVNILAAGEHAAAEKVNDESVIFRLSYGQSTALFLGDAEDALEQSIALHTQAVDLLKVAHHGSATSTTPELLSVTRPRFAVISVGAHNNYGHPRAEVLERLRAARALTYRTDVNGASTFYLHGKLVTAESYLETLPMLPARPDLRRAGSPDTPR